MSRAGKRFGDVMRHFKWKIAASAGREKTDYDLLDRFVNQRDDAAFASLVGRHASLVLGVGRRILHNDHDAEDVFQATFLILARKAASARWQKSIAGWLYCVAYRLALRTRAMNLRRRRQQRPIGISSQPGKATPGENPELLTVLDEELHHLSDSCRQPLLLCYFECQTRDQAARHLNWSLRTLERRLEQGLKLLRARLTRRGVELPVALLVAGMSQQAASACISAKILTATVEGAGAFGSGTITGGSAISANVLALAQGGLKGMAMTKLTVGAILLAAASMVATGAGIAGYHFLASEQANEKPTPFQAAVQEKPSTAALLEWPVGATVKGRVVDHKGVAVADAEVLLLGDERIIVDAPAKGRGKRANGDTRNWFAMRTDKDVPNDPPSTRTNANGEFAIVRKTGRANRLAVIASDPLLWLVHRKALTQSDHVEIKLPASGSLAIKCDLPGKDAAQPVSIQLRTFDGMDWHTDLLRFHFNSFSVRNPGEAVVEHLPPAQYAVERVLHTPIGKKSSVLGYADQQLAKVESNKTATITFDRKTGRPLTGWVRGLEKTELAYAHVTIRYLEGKGSRFSEFDVISIKPDGRFTTDPIPPGKYALDVYAVKASTLEQSSQPSDFDGSLDFTVPEKGDMPKLELMAKARLSKDGLPAQDYRVHVNDETGKPVPIFEARIVGATGWRNGRAGLSGLGEPPIRDVRQEVEVQVRAEGYAPSIIRIQRPTLLKDDNLIKLQRGQEVELRFSLPEGLMWPKKMMPEVYFADDAENVRTLHQPVNRESIQSDDNVFNVREMDGGKFRLRIAQETPPFYVAFHAPGFLQNFEAGPFTLADVKQGVLAIEVPQPASVAIRFEPAEKLDEIPWKGVTFKIFRQIEGDSYLNLAGSSADSTSHTFRQADLSPGTYQISMWTRPKADRKDRPGAEINPGIFFAHQKLVLQAGQSAEMNFQYTPFDPNAFRGRRTALLRIRTPDGKAAKDRELKVEWFDGHYGELLVYSGKVPESGELTLQGLSDRIPLPDAQRPYRVTVAGKQLGQFGFTKDEATQEFEFYLAPGPGDMAPDVELLNLATGQPIRLNSLRGKIVCLEFWATWCGPCQPAMTKLNELWRDHGSSWKDKVAIVPVSIDTVPDRVQAHALRKGWDRLGLYWTGEPSADGFDAAAARAFVVFGVPEAILIGADGRIIWRGHPLNESGGKNLKSRLEMELMK